MSAPLALAPVKPGEIEAALAALWRSAQAQGAVIPALTRACMSNLIVYCDNSQRAAGVMEDLPHVVRSHPARVLTLIDDPEAGVPQAAVSTQGVSDDHGHQVVCEHVVLRAHAVSLSSLARPLLLGDIPTSLWWAPPMAPPDGGRLFVDLARMADQVIYDSIDWHDPVAAMIATAGWASRPEILTAADLAWRRLKRWRRLLSQGLDPAVVPGALANLYEVEIEHGPHALPQAWLLMGWLAGRLNWQPVGGQVRSDHELSWELRGPRGPVRAIAHRLAAADEWQLRRVTVRWKTGTGGDEASFARDSQRLVATYAGAIAQPRSIAAPIPSRAALVARQLPDLTRDEVFVKTLGLARQMALAVYAGGEDKRPVWVTA